MLLNIKHTNYNLKKLETNTVLSEILNTILGICLVLFDENFV